jgi:hypothetical protein
MRRSGLSERAKASEKAAEILLLSGTSSFRRPLFRRLAGPEMLMAAKTLPAFRASSASAPDVPQRQRELLLAVHTRQGAAHEDFHPSVAYGTRQLQRYRHVLPEPPSRSGSPVSSLSPAATSSASKFMSATQRFASLAVFWIAPEYSLEGYQNSTTEKHVSEA